MNRDEYMQCLKYRLRRLPKEDYDKAVSYFTEYFEEAGSENEAQAIHDLGSPELAADQLIRDIAMENAKEPLRDVRHGVSAVWIGILAVFAAPLGIPLALVIGVLALIFVLLILMLAGLLFAMAVITAVSSIPCIIIGVWMLFTSFADGIATIGCGLIGLGVGYWLVTGSIAFCKSIMHLTARMFGKIAKSRKAHTNRHS